jgi:oxygen-dependent protoporphyrinogen oxidase
MTAPRVAIVGGGIAALSIAHALRAQAPAAEVLVLERSDRAGGNIRTERIDGYLCEAGPDGFLDNAPATLDFVDAIGLTPRLVRSRDEARRRYIFRRGRLHEVPRSPGAFLASPLLSPVGKLRLLGEPFAAGAPPHDESILAFAERHIGREAARVLVGSMVSGIFAGDAGQLSLRSAFPTMFEMEAQFGSLFRAMLAKRRERRTRNGMGAPAGTLTSFEGGMETLVREAAASLGGALRTGCRVADLQARHDVDDRPRPRLVGARAFSLGYANRRVEADAVVLAGPAQDSAELVQGFAPEAASLLGAIHTAPLVVLCLGYDLAALAAERGPLDGFGFLVPRGEGPRILGALWETSIYPDRAPSGKALLRVMIGGATDPEAAHLPDSALLAIVAADLTRTMNLRLAPEFVRVIRHSRGIPQYRIGHAGRLERIESALGRYGGLYLAGNSYRGVSINACIDDAKRVAGLIAAHLRTLESQHGHRTAIR